MITPPTRFTVRKAETTEFVVKRLDWKTEDSSKATGSTTLTLKIAGVPVTVSGDPNTHIPLVGGGRLIVNEQLPSTGADTGLKVNRVHLVLPADGGEVVLASTDSAMHNCGD
ncbi:choice-of-anchor P family protein [Streptomyces sp. NPDC019531]|uniref:choice-of-anchor P family protein n=1 Tax=Streptomyces sp. NPDC019531 TaxID=3365062 RepID=UPI00384BA495